MDQLRQLPLPALLAAAIFGGLLFYYVLSSTRKTKTKLPPGPRRLPGIGNAHQMPTKTAWSVFAKWGEAYGDIMHVDIFGKSFVIVNSSKIAKDLLEKRSAIYSDRPHLVMAGELIHYDKLFAMLPYGEEWRKQRRLFNQDLTQGTIPRYDQLKEQQVAILIRNLLDNPSPLVAELRLRIGVIIIRLTYGYRVEHADDPFLTTSVSAMANFAKATTPGNFLVDFIPSLKLIPPWMPGAGFLKTADEWREILWNAANNPFEWCKKNLDTEKALMPNLCATCIQGIDGKMSKDDEMTLIWSACTIMFGGLDTSISSALSFFLAMILNPSVQAKAQAELDAVVGKNRLPLIGDKPDLPYIRSIVAEVFRWAPALPLGLPHGLSKDDVYEGYELPKGAAIIPNVWHMLHDPAVYSDPMEFRPERFGGLDSEMKKVTELTFGFGRRFCIGIHFGESTLFAVVATTLATCDILPGLDENLPKYAYTSGTIVFPEPFKMRLKARSPQAAALLASVSSTVE
ncbi:putative monooxygenase [Phlegmacium glaucopus]|nr:putative monooxygenase [Phlegmacium glaucopus]